MIVHMNRVVCEQFFAVLGDRNRLGIIQSLLEGKKNVSELCKDLEMEQSLVSHHLKTLKDHGFVESQREGKHMIYTVNEGTVRPLMDTMAKHTSNVCGYGCEAKVAEWSRLEPMESMDHETEVVMRKIEILQRSVKKADIPTKTVQGVIDFFKGEMETHFRVEEQTLFPVMRKHGKEDLITSLQLEHNMLRKKFQKLEQVLNKGHQDQVREVSEEIATLLKIHTEKEDGILLPQAEELLSTKERTALKKQAKMIEAGRV